MWLLAEPYSLPQDHHVQTSQVSCVCRRGWWIWLFDQAGHALGIGEAAPWEGFGAGPAALDRELESWRDGSSFRCQLPPPLSGALLSDEWAESLSSCETLEARCYELSKMTGWIKEIAEAPELRTAIEIACLDALARHLKVPLCALLDPRAPLSVATHQLIRNPEEALRAARQGFTSLKVKVGVSDQWLDELLMLEEIHRAVPQIKLRLDANRGWSLALAENALNALKNRGVEWVEEPCSTLEQTLELAGLLRGSHSIKLALDESLVSGERSPPEVIQCALEHGLEVITLKPMVLGGLITTCQIAMRAHRVGLQVCITHMLGSQVDRRAATAVAAALRPTLGEIAAGLGGSLQGDPWSALPIFGGEITQSAQSGLGGRLDHAPQLNQSARVALHPFAELKGAKSVHMQALGHPLRAAAQARPEWAAIQEGTRQIKYQQLHFHALRVANDLHSYLQTQDEVAEHQQDVVVALQGELTLEWIIAFYGLSGLQLIIAPINPKLSEPERDRALALTGARALVTVTGSQVTVTQTRAEGALVSASPLVTLDLGEVTQPIDQIEIIDETHDACRGGEGVAELGDWGWEDPRVIICTSGTTGAPQAITLNTRQLCLSAFGSAIRLGHLTDDVWLACLPPYHVGGLSLLIRCLFNQTRAQLCPPRASRIADHILEGEVSIISLTPTLLEELISELEKRVEWRIKSTKLRVILVGGASTTQALWESATRVGLPIRLTWGMSEAASQVCTQVDSRPPSDPLPPMPFAEVKRDADLSLWVRGPTSITGLIRTSDLGEVTPRGVKIMGRSDDVILSGGVNLSPLEIEEVLMAHPAVDTAVVVGAPDPHYGARPVAFLVLGVGEPKPTAEEMHQWCRARLSAYKCPELFQWIERLPRGELGKIKRRELSDQAGLLYEVHRAQAPHQSSQKVFDRELDGRNRPTTLRLEEVGDE